MFDIGPSGKYFMSSLTRPIMPNEGMSIALQQMQIRNKRPWEWERPMGCVDKTDALIN